MQNEKCKMQNEKCKTMLTLHNQANQLSMRWFRYGIRAVKRINQLSCLLNHRTDLAWFGIQLVILWAFQPQRYYKKTFRRRHFHFAFYNFHFAFFIPSVEEA